MLTYAARRRRRWRRRRRLALLLVVAILAAVAAPALRTPHPAGPGRPVSGQAARHATPGAPGRATGGARSHLSWVNFHGIELPISATAGPHHIDNGLARGFADTPVGAVLAAVNIVVRTAAQWGPAIYRPTITHHVTGPGTRALLAADNRDYAPLRAAAHVPSGQPAGRGYAVEAAYRLAVYSPAAATADIVSEGPASNGTTVLAVTRIQLRWQHGDWRVVAPPGGSWPSSATTASSLTSYTPFPDEG
jgi:hypothetical protein